MRCGTSCSARTTRSGSGRLTTGRLVDWECGDRDERTFRRLFERLARWKVRLFCSDSYVVYPLVLAVGGHYQGKGETVALERNNGQQRHWTAAALDSGSADSGSAAALHCRLQVPRDDRAPGCPVRSPACQQGCCP